MAEHNVVVIHMSNQVNWVISGDYEYSNTIERDQWDRFFLLVFYFKIIEREMNISK